MCLPGWQPQVCWVRRPGWQSARSGPEVRDGPASPRPAPLSHASHASPQGQWRLASQTHVLARPGCLPHTCASEAMGPQGSLSNMSQLTNRVPGNERHRSPQVQLEAWADCGPAGHPWCPSQRGCRASVRPRPTPGGPGTRDGAGGSLTGPVQPPAQPRGRRGTGGHLWGPPRGGEVLAARGLLHSGLTPSWFPAPRSIIAGHMCNIHEPPAAASPHWSPDLCVTGGLLGKPPPHLGPSMGKLQKLALPSEAWQTQGIPSVFPAYLARLVSDDR